MKKEIVYIDDISYEGAGVARCDGKVVFVPKTLIGEKAEINVIKENDAYSLGQVSKVLERSEKRIEPECQYFDVCGGCDFQHCERETEKEIKKNILKRELSKIGFEGDVDFVESEKRFGYRNKITMHVHENKLGFFKPKSRDFFEVKTCPIASENINKSFEKVQRFISENNFLKINNVYFKEINNKIAICFLFGKHERKNNFLSRKLNNFELLNNFIVYFAFGDVLESNETQIFMISDGKKLTKRIDNFDYEVDISAFNQVNDDVASKLYEHVVGLCKNKRVVNAYSGQGLLTYLISKHARFVYGIEYQRSAHEKAEKLCSHVEGFKIQNICGKVEDELKNVTLRDRIDAIVLDPAREGCKVDVLDEIVKSKIDDIIYISCNFSTLTRDLKVLTKEYEVNNVKIFDMFPCCATMETVVTLKRGR